MQPTDEIHTLFASSSAPASVREAELLALYRTRKDDPAAYFAALREMPPVSLQDLEAVLPRDIIPELADGQIDYTYPIPMGEYEGQIVTMDWTTKSATLADTLLEVIYRINAEDPEFIPHYLDFGFMGQSVDLALALHVIDEASGFKEKALEKITDKDTFMLRAMELRQKFLHTKQYPFDQQLEDLTKELVSAYIIEKIPPLAPNEVDARESEVRKILNFALDYPINTRALEVINLNTPVPESLREIHREGCRKMHDILLKDPAGALWMSAKRAEFPLMSKDERLKFGQGYLDFMAHSYGFTPAPELEHKPDMTDEGSHIAWDIDDKEACFAHPLGRISINADKGDGDFKEFINTLSHEFTHGMEDAAIMLLNPEFQEWQQHQPDELKVGMGSEATLKNLRASAVLLSFNTACGIKGEFKGVGTAAYGTGAYYPPEKDETDQPGKKKDDLKYSEQLRERHARGYGYYVELNLTQSLDRVDKCRDPLNAFMMAQQQMLKVEGFIKEQILPFAPDDRMDKYKKAATEIDAKVRIADARESTYDTRLKNMMLALRQSKNLLMDACVDRLAGFSDDKGTWSLYNGIGDVENHTFQALMLLRHAKTQTAPELRAEAAPA